MAETSTTGGWLERHPAIAPLAASAVFLALFQAIFVASKYASINIDMALGLGRFGVLVGIVTVVLASPIVLLGRRFHPAWKAGDKSRASRDLSFSLVAGLAGWMVVDGLLAELMPGPPVPWIALVGAAVAAYIAVDWIRLPQRVERSCLVILPILLVVVLLPFGPGGPPSEGDLGEEVEVAELVPAPNHTGSHPDVVLISVDTLRADRLGAYGRQPSLTPALDRLAAEGVVFERALASSPWTIPSVASMLTGLPSTRHGAGLALSSGMTFLRSPLGAEQTTVAERFSATGYRTRAVVANGFLHAGMGMAQGFDELIAAFQQAIGLAFGRDLPLVRLIDNLMPRTVDYRAVSMTDTALDMLADGDGDGDGKPLFLWVHYIDPHVPYQADPDHLDLEALLAEASQTASPEVLEDGTVVGEVFAATEGVRSGMTWLMEEDRRRLVEYYDDAVTYVDENVGRLIEALRERSAVRPVIVAFTSDHGEELWDHGGFEHGHDYYREVTQVPFILWGSGVPAGREVDEVVGLVDIPSTLIELAGFVAPQPEHLDEGRSLVALLDDSASGDGTTAPAPPRFSGGNLYGLPAVMVEEGPWRFVLRANGAAELYDVFQDPEERYNVADHHPELSARYRQLLAPRLEIFVVGKRGEQAELSPETIEALRSLGYVQ